MTLPSWSPNPRLYVHPLAQSKRNLQYGPDRQHRLNVYLHATRLTGGNPICVVFHEGGFGSFDKTTIAESSRFMELLWARRLDPSYGESPMDMVFVEVRMHAYDSTATAPLSTPYETTFEGTNYGRYSAPAYGLSWVDDAQRAVQWVKDQSNRFGFDPTRVLTAGASAGGTIALCAAFRPTRHYTDPSHARSPWDAFSTSDVKGVLNAYGVINLSPWFTDFTLVGGHFGYITNDNTKTRADLERLLLVPDTSGLYPSTVSRSAVCKAVSPVDVIAAATGGQKSVKVYSAYRSDESTTVPVATYAPDIPPYGPHDPVQRTILQGVCDDAGVSHTGVEMNMTLGTLDEVYEYYIENNIIPWMDDTAA